MSPGPVPGINTGKSASILATVLELAGVHGTGRRKSTCRAFSVQVAKLL
jgi:hypothetical protein